MPQSEDVVGEAADLVEAGSIPIFSKGTLEKNLGALGPELLKIIREEAAKFVTENRVSATQLSVDAMKAILLRDVFQKIDPMVIVPGMSLEQCVKAESYLAVRSEIFALVAAAELKHATQVAELKAKAKSAAARIAGVVIGLGLKAVIGG